MYNSFVKGQDPNDMPYDKHSPLEDQVKTSFQTSLDHFVTNYIDSLVLHSPMSTMDETIRVWRVFEQFHSNQQVRYLGISNCYDVKYLQSLYETVSVKPTFVQNRFYGKTGFDREIREFCEEKQIRYQSFWTLTANPAILNNAVVLQSARMHKKSPQQIFFKFVQSLGIIPLSGTTSLEHMRDDMQLNDFELSSGEEDYMKNLINDHV